MNRTPVSRFGVLVVIWAATVSCILAAALHRNAIGTTRNVSIAVFILAVSIGLERMRVNRESRQRRDHEELRRTARRFSA